MFPVLQIGPAVIQTALLLLLAGVWLATDRVERLARRRGLSGDLVLAFAFAPLGAALLVGRLAYALQHIPAYLDDPLGLISPTVATLDLMAGALAALAAGFILMRIWSRRGHPIALFPLLDVMAPGLAVMMVAFSASHLASGAGYGAPAHLPWSIYLWDAWRHPTQVYELLAALGVWLFIERLAGAAPRARVDRPAGVLFFTWLSLAAAARLILEAFRGDSLLWGGGVRAAQVVALAVLLIALWCIGRMRRTPEDSAVRVPDLP